MLNNLFKGQKSKILISLLLSFFLIVSFSNKIFLAGTPKIRPNLMVKIKNKTRTILVNIPFLNQFNNIDIPEEKLRPIGKGVKAYEDKKKNILYIKYEKDAQFEERIIRGKDGKEYKIYIPKTFLK